MLMLLAGGALAGAVANQLLIWGLETWRASKKQSERPVWVVASRSSSKRRRLHHAESDIGESKAAAADTVSSHGLLPAAAAAAATPDEEEKLDGLVVAERRPDSGGARHRYWCSKAFHDLPCAHRQAAHEGHCRFIHGYSRSIRVFFACDSLDENGFVVDFGSLKTLQKWLTEMFDHTMLINADDPERELFEEMHRRGVVDLRVMPNVGMEESSRIVFEFADEMIRSRSGGRCWVFRVETHENSKNCGSYELME